ncbi:methyl-CpG-binding domain-containing protein 2-like isoform X1 [Salvia miltiorrhiza]|uniref:methyl-CpG-binding domain-containing protein 2-like isoform X1 n=1 Tax=Salvia miltiorrhiza TaxID=226208 RepID=UPI0025ABBC8D|nr:methyl-CpG-binding domain-containing protein 2-like isoform X1 [Salvia miltiorrhiza]XP_057806504.1 methyl-CpG-binding domain-containing protein 2-like isoform X1 [Salvia miltiorrhiza]
MEPHSLKLTIKLKSEKSVNNSLTTADHLSNVGEKSGAINSYRPGSLAANSQDPVDFSSAGGLENHSRKNEENPSEISQYQLVLYNPTANGSGEAEIPDPISDRPSSQRQNQKALSVGAFTVQCANCFKWRLIPTQEKYEDIREHIMEQPFVCEAGREWRPDISCDDPPDLVQDGSRLWAIDKPSIARPPPGWQRLLKFRGEGSSKFADVYYVAPSGKRLRSMVEVQRYLEEHPEYKEQGVRLSQFSFQIPRPLQENYVRKRPNPARAAPTSDADDLGMLRFPHPSEVQPISWVRPDVDTELQLSRPGPSTDFSESPDLKPETQSAKKKKTKSRKWVDGELVHSPITFKMREPDQL